MRTLETRVGSVAYEEHGTGFPLLLLHANGHAHFHFDDIVPELARSYRTIALDWPGCGESAVLHPSQKASAMLMADVLEDVVAGLSLESAILLGHSVGGYAATRLAIRQPERVRALILVDSGGFTPASRFFCWLLGQEWVTRHAAVSFAKFYLKRRTPLVERILARIAQDRTIPSWVATNAALWRSFAHPEHDLRSLASQITAPTLLIYGRFDPIIRFKRDQAASSIPHAQHVVLETGHEPFAEDPEAFFQAINPFLHALQAGRSSHVSSN
jgi:pimeloyl-ACP methyl ester carboxylesterase